MYSTFNTFKKEFNHYETDVSTDKRTIFTKLDYRTLGSATIALTRWSHALICKMNLEMSNLLM